MRKVRILSPVDGHEVGTTPEVFGWKGREYIAAGVAEWDAQQDIAAEGQRAAIHHAAKKPRRAKKT